MLVDIILISNVYQENLNCKIILRAVILLFSYSVFGLSHSILQKMAIQIFWGKGLCWRNYYSRYGESEEGGKI
jgi:hypothetical protein